ncbi:MAG: Spy/CpxP family protein refolding chaperone [Persicimonas sp.]
MKQVLGWIRPLLIVFSVGFNIAFVSVWAVHTFGGHGGAGCTGDASEAACPLERELGISEAQKEELKPIQKKFRTSRGELCQTIRRHRIALLEELESADPDQEAIEAARNEIAAHQRQMQQLVIDHLLAEKEVLDPDQQREFFDRLRSHSDCAGAMAPGQERGHGPGSFE